MLGWFLGGGGTPAAAQDSSLFVAPPKTLNQCVGTQAPKRVQFTKLPGPGGNTLFVWGGIDIGATPRLAQAIEEARPVKEITLCSPGGVLDAGIDMGYLIREKRLATRLPSGFYCVSACNFVLMGGIIRTVEPGAHFMVHMFAQEEFWRRILLDMATQWCDPPRPVPTSTATTTASALPPANQSTSSPTPTTREKPVSDTTVCTDLTEFNKRFPNKAIGASDLHDTVLQWIKHNPGMYEAFIAREVAAVSKTSTSSDTLNAEAKRKHPIDQYVKQHFLSVEETMLSQTALQEDVKAREQDTAQGAAEIAVFLLKMSESINFLTAFANIPNDVPRALTRGELSEYNIVNTP